MSQEVIDAIVAEAHQRKVRVAAHAQGSAAIRAAAAAGVDSIEHGGLIDDEAARMLAAKQIPLVPTLARIRNDELRTATSARVRRARELGVSLVFGTDATVLPHGENARELASLLAVGLTPIEPRQTRSTLQTIGWPTRVGSIDRVRSESIVVGNDCHDAVPLDVKVVSARGRIVRNELARFGVRWPQPPLSYVDAARWHTKAVAAATALQNHRRTTSTSTFASNIPAGEITGSFAGMRLP